MKQTARFMVAVAAAVAAAVLQASEVTPAQAKTAVGNWVAVGPSRMDSRFKSSETETPKTFRNALGRAVYHAVNLKGGGFVVTSGDTRISPIVAFSTTGRFGGDEKGPFHALLRGNMANAMSAVERSDKARKSASVVAYASSADPCAVAMSEWAELLPAKASAGDHGPSAGGSQKASVSDVRVNKLLKTEWSQDWCYIYNGADTCNVYNYYTPKNYPCGCVATAGAQIMMRWKQPKTSIAQFSNKCTVDDKSVTRKSVAGAFDWDNMFLKWDTKSGPLPEAQIKAVSMLTYNIGVAVNMAWGDWYGSAYTKDLVDALKSRFGYKSGVWMFYDLDTLDKEAERPSDMEARLADFDNAVYASLDAKMPVVMGIIDKTSYPGYNIGHAIVADGYGYTSGKRYTHLNFGWDGMDDAWYYLPNDSMLVKEGYQDYSEIECIGFNIHPTAAGDVISGRVLDASGTAVSGADVTLYDSSNKAKKTVTTDSKGIYSFRVTAKGSYTVRAVHSATTEQPSTPVSIAMLSENGSFYDGYCMTGNRWGVEVKFPSWVAPVSRTLTLTPNNKNYGTVSGGGKYMAGTVVKLKATATSGNAFAGWFTDKSCTAKLNPTGYDNRNPEVQVAMPSANTTIYAKFVTKAEAKKSLKFTSSTQALATTPKKSMSGYEFSLSLGAASATLVTFSAKGLPYGLTLDPATGKITGTPVKPGYYDVTITVKDAAGNKITQIVKLTLGVLSWSKGD
ncbi:MAG: C10 family peptidase, partial [Kiritimatiellae bacterium]|nr:C10 family peptidase [Kiritimatiellia bacterium]